MKPAESRWTNPKDTPLTIDRLRRIRASFMERDRPIIYLEFYRRPRTKKRRIIRKWRYNIRNWRPIQQ